MVELSGKVVAITGGSRGIGFGLAEGVCGAGASVALLARNLDPLQIAVASLRERFGEDRVEGFVCDVAHESDVISAFVEIDSRFGRLDGVFANAGISAPHGGFLESSVAGWSEMLNTNLIGAMTTLREGARRMISQGDGGSLVAVSSLSAVDAAPGALAYAASKAGLLALVRGLAVELARYQIRVNAIVPGWIDTEMTAPLQSYAKFMDATLKRTPVRRWGQPHDFVEIAAFLADPTLTFHTGDSLVVDGGYSIF